MNLGSSFRVYLVGKRGKADLRHGNWRYATGAGSDRSKYDVLPCEPAFFARCVASLSSGRELAILNSGFLVERLSFYDRVMADEIRREKGRGSLFRGRDLPKKMI